MINKELKSEKMLSREEQTELMEKIAAGDSEAFEEFSARFRPVIFGTALKVLKHHEDALDVTAEVLISIWRKAGKFQSSRGTLIGWICQISRNRAIDRVRDFRRRSGLHSRYEEQLEKEEPSLPRNSLRTDVYRSDARRILEDTLDKLSSEQREVIGLAYFEGLSQSQISSRISRPIGTVKARTRRALLQLRSRLSQRLNGEIPGLIAAVSN